MDESRAAVSLEGGTGRTKFKDTTSDVRRRLVTIVAVLRYWKKNGVPPDVSLPKSLNGAREWVDEKWGIEGGFSNRDLNMRSPRYGRLSRWINELIAKAGMPAETRKVEVVSSTNTPTRKRRYRSEQSRRIDAENKNIAYAEMVKNITAEWHRAREEKDEAVRMISKIKKEIEGELDKIVALKSENASLKRQLSSTGIFPRPVEK